MGHVRCSKSHGSMQMRWNSCLKVNKISSISRRHFDLGRLLTHLHGRTRITSVALYGSIQMAQQSCSLSFISSDLILFVGILAMTRFATVHSCRCEQEIDKLEKKSTRLRHGFNYNSPIYGLLSASIGSAAHNRRPAKRTKWSLEQWTKSTQTTPMSCNQNKTASVSGYNERFNLIRLTDLCLSAW